jgi:hypothetical protein
VPEYDDDVYVTSYNIIDTTLGDDSDRKTAQAKNATRQAWCEMTLVSSGIGQRRHGLMTFNCVFTREPHLSTGCGTVKNPVHGVWHDAIGTSGVYAWKRDTKGHYVGAYVWTRVDIYPIDVTSTATPPAALSTQHFLTFSGVATKNIGSGSSAAQSVAKVKKPGI